jgi:CheY-like chemotaxis protein
MSDHKRLPIRVLFVDDEADIRDAYLQSLRQPDATTNSPGLRDLQARLFNKAKGNPSPATTPARSTTFDPVFCDQADAAVVAVEQALAQNQPFAVVFMDMLMPPGKDGVWAAARIRELDPAVEIVICTAYSDVDPSEIGGIVPPEEKLSYLQKPFHAHEVRQTDYCSR